MGELLPRALNPRQRPYEHQSKKQLQACGCQRLKSRSLRSLSPRSLSPYRFRPSQKPYRLRRQLPAKIEMPYLSA